MTFSIAAKESTGINHSTLLAIFICDVLRILEGQRTFEQGVVWGKISGNGSVHDEKGLRPLDVGCTVPSYVTTQGADAGAADPEAAVFCSRGTKHLSL